MRSLFRSFERAGLDYLLISGQAAILYGGATFSEDIHPMFRNTPGNRRKLKVVARALDAVILAPYYPASELFRLVDDERGLQADFMAQLDGIRSFEALRARATTTTLGGATLLVADLRDIVRSKRAANRPRDRAVLPVLEATLREKARQEG